MNKKTFAQHKGFTLLETLFSILIFSAALISLMTIAAAGISATDNAEQTTSASYLAQEGIEVARNIRDTNYATNAAWDATISSCTQTAPCMISYGATLSVPTLVSCGGATCPAIKQSAATGWYADQGTPTEFYRTIYAIPAPLPANSTIQGVDEYQIISRVNWTYRTIPHVVTLDTILKDWQ